jgi:hypothetical protein
MKSEHDHWGEMRALRKKMRRAIDNPYERALLWQRYVELSHSLEATYSPKWQAHDAAIEQRAKRRVVRAVNKANPCLSG